MNGDWVKCPDFCYWNGSLSELAGKLGNDVRVTKLSGAQSKEEILDLILCEDDQLGEVDQLLNEEEIVDLDIDF